MKLTIEKIPRWRTSDGAEHSSRAMAQQHIANAEMVALLSDHGEMTNDVAQDILNILSGNAPKVREWLDANDTSMRVAQTGKDTK